MVIYFRVPAGATICLLSALCISLMSLINVGIKCLLNCLESFSLFQVIVRMLSCYSCVRKKHIFLNRQIIKQVAKAEFPESLKTYMQFYVYF